MPDLEFEDVHHLLSAPVEATPKELSRRRFLQAAAMGAGAMALLPTWLRDEAGAVPLGPSDGVLVLVMMGGGNDGLNTLAPVADGTYRDKRGGLAVTEAAGLPVGAGLALHPALGGLKRRFDQGKLALVQGVGNPVTDLSHFTSMASWMQGWANGGPPITGWLGRWLDGVAGADALRAVTVGSSVPLHLVGTKTKAVALSSSAGDLFGSGTEAHEQRMYDCVGGFGGGANGIGPMGDLLGRTGRASIALSRTVKPLYKPDLPGGRLASQLGLCARLVNADVGARVLNVAYGDFDHHADQGWKHNERMKELDAGIEAFFSTLDPRFAGRVTVLTFSEFGRRVERNGSGGTDHGTASVMLAVGDKVKGGLYGAMPSLTALDRSGNMVPTVDFRSVYGSVLDGWLGGGSSSVLGRGFENLNLFRSGPSA
jgi:uncharacterized protein (DUF1501 family)